MSTERALMVQDDAAAIAKSLFPWTAIYLHGEREDHQKILFEQICDEIKPRDCFEDQWVLDVFDCTWNIIRYRNLKVLLLNASAYLGLEKVLATLIGPTDAAALASDWHGRDENAVSEVNRILASANLPLDAAMAETMALRLAEVERVDRMIGDTLGTRASIFREIERHRSELVRKSRGAMDQIEDAQFTEVDEISNPKGNVAPASPKAS